MTEPEGLVRSATRATRRKQRLEIGPDIRTDLQQTDR